MMSSDSTEKLKENSNSKPRTEILESRRKFLKKLGWAGVIIFLLGNLIVSMRFFFPRVLFEPPIRFKVGRPSEYPKGQVSTEYKEKYGIWIIRDEDGRFFCLSIRCTHLGCTPNWLETQKKFKCPCHGSGFYKDGENFEGPAPRPLDRFKMTLSGDGYLIVDKSIIFKGVAGMSSAEIHPQSLLEV